jgi:hypothetical protein
LKNLNFRRNRDEGDDFAVKEGLRAVTGLRRGAFEDSWDVHKADRENDTIREVCPNPRRLGNRFS